MLVLICSCIGWLLVATPAEAAPPSNDDFANAQIVVNDAGGFAVAGTNAEATLEAGEPLGNANEGAATVWFDWRAKYDANVILDTGGSDFDTVLAVYTGASPAVLVQVASDDDSGPGVTSQLSFLARAGAIYHIQVGGFNLAAGNVALNALLVPANDNFAAATDLGSGLSGTIDGSTWNATWETDEPPLVAQPLLAQHSVWYSWQAPYDGSVNLSLAGCEQTDALAVVATGTDFSDIQIYALNQLPVSAGTTYHFLVVSRHQDGNPVDYCDFTLNWDEPQNDLSTTQRGPAATTVGGTATYSVSVHNAGPAPAVAVRVRDTLPTGLEILGATPGPGPSNWVCSPGPTAQVDCTIDQLAVGATTKITIRVVSPIPQTVTSDVTVTSPGADANLANNRSILSTAVNAAPKTIYTTVDEDGFAAPTLTVKQGWTVFWNNTGEDAHSVTDASGLGLFDLLGGQPVSFGKFTFNGAGRYAVTDTLTGNSQTISVPIALAPKSGTVSTQFGVGWAANNPPAGYVYDIDLRRPGSIYVDWQTTTGKSTIFVPDAGPGKYTFRARMRRLSDSSASGWATHTITVS